MMLRDSASIQNRRDWVRAAALLFLAAPSFVFANQAVSFSDQILPVLSEHCLTCHGPDAAERKAGLRLDQEERALRELKSGSRAVVPGDPESSEMIRRIFSTDPDETMPPPEFDKPLSQEQRTLLRRWISEGAEYEKHWAFQPISRPALPPVSNNDWPRQGIDYFVLHGLESQGVIPSPPADPGTLIKRLYYDLIGLLPKPAEADAFVENFSEKSYARVVDDLLASPHFGERWGRHWLDKARYADSDGYEKDNPRPFTWNYRDWVIQAINDDMPFDQFTMEQLAGDLLPEPSKDQLLATAFHRQTLTNTEGGTDKEQWRVAAVMDRTDTTSAVWLGLTMGCAKCHDHKYDPISQKEYYRLYAFFNNGDETEMKLARSKQEEAEYQTALKRHRNRIEEVEESLRNIGGEPSDLEILAAENLKKKLESLKENPPAPPYMDVRIITQRTDSPRQTHVLRRGEFSQPLEEVEPGTPSALPSLLTGDKGETPDRLDLAKWLVSADNPLTPRVTVNEIWSHLFGQGLAATPNDFGIRGERPTHPELLDYLAREFVRNGWSRKALIRRIVLSAAYRQSSKHRPEFADRDPKNRWLARQNRFRVEAELIRDLTLDAAGLLSRKVGGPSVFPPTDPAVVALTYNSSVQWKVSPGEDKYRRGMYTFFKRTAPHPTLITFDCPDSNTTSVERRRSNTPLGALTTLNNEVFVEAANAFALRALASDGNDDRARMIHAFRIAAVRTPKEEEVKALLGLLEESREWYWRHPEDASKLLGDQGAGGVSPEEQAAWSATVRVLLNLDEFFTRT